MQGMRMLAVLGAVATAFALPAAASAADDTADVDGTVGSELSVSAPNATLSAFSPSTDGTGASIVTVSSTETWTLTIEDAGATTPGQMDRVDCDTREATGGSLDAALGFSGTDGSGSLSATPATVRTSSGVEDVTVDFTQTIGSTENLVAGECYELQATFTAT